jgi:hypothetical protein
MQDWFEIISIIFAVIGWIATIYMTIVTFQHYRKTGARHTLLLFCTFFLLVIWGLVQGIFVIIRINPLRLLASTLLAVSALLLIVFLDTIAREGNDLIKLIFFTNLIVAALIFFIFVDPSISNYLYDVGLFFLSFLFISYALKIYKNAPTSVKFDSFLFLIGGSIGTVIPSIVLFLADLKMPINTSFAGLFLIIGMLVMAYTIKKQPILAYILPFRASRLSVIAIDRGISIFDHIWDKEQSGLDNDLYGGMLQGIGAILNETLNMGNVRQIVLERATLIIYQDPNYPVAYVLLSNQFNTALQLALKKFAGKFVAEFSEKFINLSDVNQFASATDIIDYAFPFLPAF